MQALCAGAQSISQSVRLSVSLGKRASFSGAQSISQSVSACESVRLFRRPQAFDRSFEMAIAALGAPIVGILAEKVFGFKGTAATSAEVRAATFCRLLLLVCRVLPRRCVSRGSVCLPHPWRCHCGLFCHSFATFLPHWIAVPSACLPPCVPACHGVCTTQHLHGQVAGCLESQLDVNVPSKFPVASCCCSHLMSHWLARRLAPRVCQCKKDRSDSWARCLWGRAVTERRQNDITQAAPKRMPSQGVDRKTSHRPRPIACCHRASERRPCSGCARACGAVARLAT
jgi:hypothetical protein